MHWRKEGNIWKLDYFDGRTLAIILHHRDGGYLFVGPLETSCRIIDIHDDNLRELQRAAIRELKEMGI